MKTKALLIITSITLLILLFVFVAMRYTDEVNWTIGEFLIAGILIFEVGLMINYTNRRAKKSRMRLLFYIVIAIVLILIWAELGVGILGTPFAGS